MKRILIGLVPWMGLYATTIAVASAAQFRAAEVVYTHFKSSPVHAYRLGDECYVPVDEVATWGWQTKSPAQGQAQTPDAGDQIEVQAEGVDFTIPVTRVSGVPAISMNQAVSKMRAGGEWVPEQDTYEVYSVLDALSCKKAVLKATAPLAFEPWSRVLTAPDRLVIDLDGTRLGASTKLDLDVDARAFQFKRNVVRVVIVTHFLPTPLPLSSTAPAPQINLDINPPVAATQQAAPETPKTPVPTPVTSASTIAMRVASDTPTETRLEMFVPAHTPLSPEYRKPDPAILEVVMRGENYSLPAGFQSGTDSVIHVDTRTEGADTVLRLILARPMGANVSSQATNDGDLIKIDLLKPEVGDGHLAKKVVVVDPGHGGRDKGAHSYGINEKDLNLTIGRLLADRLASEGATVIMTRTSDVFIPLTTRAEIANNNHADFFISCHINSTGGSGTQSGGITFHHLGKSVSRLLGECIQSEVAKVSGIPNLGVWSDAKVWRSGFSVLRNTQMPGVLLELGFINDPRDCHRLCQEGFQKAVAQAVVKGIKDFLGDDTKK